MPELMRKIEQVVTNNKGHPFQLDKEICDTVERKYSQRILKDSRKCLSMSSPPPDSK